MEKALKILLITNGIILLAAAMMGPIYAIFVEKIGGDILTAGSTFAIFSLTAGLLTLVFGRFSDKIKEQELVVVLGYVVIAIGFAGYLFVKSPLMLFIVQIIIGLGEAINTPSFDALYSKHLTAGKAAFQWGAWESMRYIATALGSIVGAAIAHFLGFPILFIVMAAMALASAVYVFSLPRKIL